MKHSMLVALLMATLFPSAAFAQFDTATVVGTVRDTVTVPTDPRQPFGNAPRNSVRGPWFWQMDLVAAKDFPLPIGPQTRIQVRLEAFNVLNKVNFRAPNANRSAADYGTITGTFDARQLQLGIKLMF